MIFSEPGPDPSVTIVISHLNSIRTIGQCLAALAAQTYDHGRYEIVVVDAGSTDGSIEVVRELRLPNLRLIVDVGCSEPAGQNIGAERSKGDLIFFTNSDIYTPPDWITRHVGWHRKGYDLVGGRYIWGGDKFAYAWNAPHWGRPDHRMAPGRGVGFGNCSMSRDLYRRCGGIRDLESHQDIDFMLRAEREGARLVVDPDLVVYHDHPFGSLRGSFLRSYGYTFNHLTVIGSFYRQLGGDSRSPFDSPTALAAELLKEVLGLTGVRAYRDSRAIAEPRGLRIGLIEFLYLRYSARELGYFLGVLRGLLANARRPGEVAVRDLHKTPQRRK